MEAIGRYRILSELGRGAMGIVYRAQDPAIGRAVAIKTIRLADLSDAAESERLRDRLFREAQSAGILSHPGIVVVYDVGEDGEITYIAMEFVNGPSLEKILAGEAPPEPEAVLKVLQQTAAALDYAHKKGIVHRDIKPGNIMIDEDGTVKITDFGIAKISASHQLTQTGTVMGTPNYMSPEQVQGRPVDGKADQFALAVVAYEMLTGERPFTGEQLTTVLYKIVSEDPPPPQHLNPTLGFAVSMVLLKALAKDSAKRYPSCTEFVAALEAALNSKKGWRPLARGASQNLPTEIVASGPLSARPRAYRDAAEQPRRGRAWKAIAAGILSVGIVALAFVATQRWLMTRRPEQPAAAATPTPKPVATSPKPSPMPPPKPQVGPGANPAATPEVRTRPAETPPPPVPSPLQIVTDPPGATILLDDDPAKTCTTPCNLQVLAGRHTLAATLTGYRRELRIIDLNGPKELFIPLSQPTGTVLVESDPPGAQIVINDKPRSERTPATFVLPVGKYVLVVTKDGRRAVQPIEVKDGSLLKFDLQITP
jgi:serine/threonine protein kinase